MKQSEKYETLLLALAELLKQKDDQIILLSYEVGELKRQLKAAEKTVESKGGVDNE